MSIEKITCAGGCNRTLKVNNANFYKSTKPEYEKTDGFCYICKSCIREMCYNSDNTINLNGLHRALEMLDRPFIKAEYMKILSKGSFDIGTYLKNVSFNSYRKLTYGDSDRDNNDTQTTSNAQDTKRSNEVSFTVDELEVLEDKWGFGYTKEEYYFFEKKWKKLIDNYGEKTTLHTEALITYIRFRVREEMATARGDIKEAKEWGALAAQAQKDGKLNVAQLSKSDISGGVDLVCQIFEAVESEVGIIPLLPKLIEQPYDDADMIIWAVINYGRRLDDKPRVAYKDIWYFYDEMLEEYFKQQGFNHQQIAEFKAKRNNIFRDLESVYKEPLYNESDE